MYGRILGFQRLARCPKWTPASIKSLTCTMATHCSPAPWRVRKRLDDGKHLNFAVHSRTPSAKGKRFIVALQIGWVKAICPESPRRYSLGRKGFPVALHRGAAENQRTTKASGQQEGSRF